MSNFIVRAHQQLVQTLCRRRGLRNRVPSNLAGLRRRAACPARRQSSNGLRRCTGRGRCLERDDRRTRLKRKIMSSQLSAFRAWLLAPVWQVADIKRRLVFRALRSRLLFIVALLISIPAIIPAFGAMWKAGSGKVDSSPAFMWSVAIGYWIIFALTCVNEYWYLRKRAGRKESMRLQRQKLKAISAQLAKQARAQDKKDS